MNERATSARFPELRLSGSASARGLVHGEQLRGRIEQTLDYYRQLFGMNDAELRRQAAPFAKIIGAFNAEYALEIDAIARASGIDPLYIYALNSRSEILNNIDVAECTAVMNCADSVLAQNWDWSEALEPLVVLLAIEREDGHRISMLTEPGIIGKIGMNSAGIGACLNILKTDRTLSGVPVHILLRAIMDCGSMVEVRQLLANTRVGKASHVLVGDAAGACLSIEFAGEDSFPLSGDAGVFLHTNHYLADGRLNTRPAFQSTAERLRKAREMLAEDNSAAGLRRLLLDQSEAELSICRAYSPSLSAGFGDVGTVFTVLMDLRAGAMLVRRGADPESEFYRVVV